MARTGRPRGFDEEQVIERARDLFWSRGYGATSVQELLNHLALQRGSMYGTFGDKRALYLRAVELYVRENRRYLQAVLQRDPLLPALRELLVEPALLTGAVEREPTRGCLVGNTTAELVPADEEARALVVTAYDGFIEDVATALARAQANGEVARSAAPEAQAQLLLLLFQGSALIARADQGDRQRVAAGIDAALESLRA
ncbi:MAG: TetR/AcrR family transcriptional regulator [Solirubrobacterales bacterium]|nr:TetR/AcrR family transcriptional regulator [Solirubrobacterales bacterium]